MLVSTIKHNNLSSYGRISTSKSCRYEEFAPLVITLQDIYTLRNPRRCGREKIEEIVSTETLHSSL